MHREVRYLSGTRYKLVLSNTHLSTEKSTQPQNLPIPLRVEHFDLELGVLIWSLLVELNEHIYK